MELQYNEKLNSIVEVYAPGEKVLFKSTKGLLTKPVPMTLTSSNGLAVMTVANMQLTSDITVALANPWDNSGWSLFEVLCYDSMGNYIPSGLTALPPINFRADLMFTNKTVSKNYPTLSHVSAVNTTQVIGSPTSYVYHSESSNPSWFTGGINNLTMNYTQATGASYGLPVSVWVTKP